MPPARRTERAMKSISILMSITTAAAQTTNFL
jgi:hypothetical protein